MVKTTNQIRSGTCNAYSVSPWVRDLPHKEPDVVIYNATMSACERSGPLTSKSRCAMGLCWEMMSFAQKLAMSENEEKPQDPQVMYPVLQRHGGGVPVFLMSIIMMYDYDVSQWWNYVVSNPNIPYVSICIHMYPYVSQHPNSPRIQ